MTTTTRVAGLLVGCLLGITQVASAASWTPQPVPAPRATNGTLIGITCTGTTCEAVGTNLDTNGNQVPLAEVWSGTAWTRQAVPTPTIDPRGNSLNELTALSCSAADACTALDIGVTEYQFGSHQLTAMRWNGSRWARQTITLPSGAYGILNAISCAGPAACTAVGSYGTVQGLDLAHPLVEFWNGTKWSAQTAPVSEAETSASLNGVSCDSLTVCVAVGSTIDSSAQQSALAEFWNGTHWIEERPGATSGATSVRLNAISCFAPTGCFAVGQSSAGALAERLGGNTWTPATVAGPSRLDAVSCTAATACTAVGQSQIERWNGATWTAQSPPANATPATLVGVSCSAAKACTAVGATGDGFPTGAAGSRGAMTYIAGEGVAIADGWTGSAWSKQTTVDPTGAGSVTVGGVSCVTLTSCMLVGSYVDVRTERVAPLAEMRTGTGWTIVKVPEPAVSESGFNSVSCTAATACIAVGIEASGSTPTGIYGVWNGTTWTLGSIPLPSGDFALDPLGVSCTAATNCVMVGYDDASGGQQAMSGVWNGSSWSSTSVQEPPATSSVLSSLSCTSSSSCAAAGSYADSTGTHALAETFLGSVWENQYIASPPGSTGGDLLGASCSTAGNCTVVGESYSSSSAGGQIDRYNGTYWDVQSAPSSPALAQLVGVSCATATACTSVASTASTDWDGTSWGSAVPFAAPADGGTAAIDSIDCLAPQQCIAVGSSAHLLASQVPLVEAYF